MSSTPSPATFRTSRGRPLPLGVSQAPEGLNFGLLCRHGTAVTLLIQPIDESINTPLATFILDPRLNRTGDHWHILVFGLPEQIGFRYGWIVDGPSGEGNRYDPNQVLLDPSSPLLSGGAVWGVSSESDRHKTDRRSLYFRGPRYDWGEDVPPNIPHEETIVYELPNEIQSMADI